MGGEALTFFFRRFIFIMMAMNMASFSTRHEFVLKTDRARLCYFDSDFAGVCYLVKNGRLSTWILTSRSSFLILISGLCHLYLL